MVLRSTNGIEGQNKSKNYNATYFTSNTSHAVYFIGEGGYMGAYVLTHTDKFIDLQYNEEDYEYEYEDEEVDLNSFGSKQEKKILEVAIEFYKKENPTRGEVEDMMENPSKEVINFLRKKVFTECLLRKEITLLQYMQYSMSILKTVLNLNLRNINLK